MMRRFTILLLLTALAGCGRPEPAGANGESSLGDASDGNDDDEAGEQDEESEDDGGTFLPDFPDWPPFGECDFWDEEACPAGEKCQPVNAGSGNPYDAFRCVPAGSDAVDDSCCMAGDPDCPMEGPPGTDSCDGRSMCQFVDPQTGQGTCIETCSGTYDDRECPLSGNGCWSFYRDLLNLCLAPCDPLEPDGCDLGRHCWIDNLHDPPTGAACIYPPSTSAGGIGEDCGSNQDCQLGLHCDERFIGPNSWDVERKCTEVCDVNESDFVCTDPDRVCTPIFEPDHAHHAHVGLCRLSEDP